jgi:3',5'-cyclic AMP phosphodiesterase CpdA
MLIAQITDTHIRANGAFAFDGKADTSARLAAAVRFLATHTPRPDVVLATGDLADTGSAADYRKLAELLAPLEMPVLPIPGNHDSRAPLQDAFPGIARRAATRYVQYAVDDYPVRLIAIDTLQEGRIGGYLCAERLAWIGHALAASPRPTVLFMHHPPFDLGIAGNDDMRCEGAAELERIVRAHGNVQAVLCGHLHRPVARRWGGTIAAVVPATAPTLELLLTGDGPSGWVDSPPMVGLHLWRDGDGLVSHVAATDEASRYAAFSGAA